MRKLSVSLLLLVLIAIISAGWGIDKLFTLFYKAEDTNLTAAKSIGADLAKTLDSINTETLLDDSLDSSLAVLEYDELALPTELQTLLEKGQSITLESDNEINLYFDLPNTKRVLTVTIPYQNNTATPVRLMLTLLFYTSIISLVLLWLYPLIRRLQALEKTAKAFGEGKLDRRVSTHASSQLHSIESEFNSMARRIDGLVSDNKLLSSAVSHDLRTPLARLRFGVDALQETVDDDAQSHYLERISDDLTEMEQLVSVLLEFAKLDNELHDLPLSQLNLVPIVEHAVQSARDFSDHTITFKADQSTMNVIANDRYTSIMLNNLLQNAIRYGRSTVEAKLISEDSQIVLYLDDDGPGIPSALRAQVLKPFIRNTDQQGKHGSRSGYGLGLAIVSRIAQWHKAELTIEDSSELGGARIKLAFPV